jgi:hypothetical protein
MKIDLRACGRALTSVAAMLVMLATLECSRSSPTSPTSMPTLSVSSNTPTPTRPFSGDVQVVLDGNALDVRTDSGQQLKSVGEWEGFVASRASAGQSLDFYLFEGPSRVGSQPLALSLPNLLGYSIAVDSANYTFANCAEPCSPARTLRSTVMRWRSVGESQDRFVMALGVWRKGLQVCGAVEVRGLASGDSGECGCYDSVERLAELLVEGSIRKLVGYAFTNISSLAIKVIWSVFKPETLSPAESGPEITTQNPLPPAVRGSAYAASLEAQGGAPPYRPGNCLQD